MDANVIEKLKGGKRRWPVSGDALAELKDWCAGPPVGVRIDPARLDDEEQHELLELRRAAFVQGGGGWNLNQLGKRERRAFEKLVEKAAGVEAGAFQREREAEEMRETMSALARRAAKPRPPGPGQEIGLLLDLHRLVKGRSLHIDRLGVFTYVAGQLLAAEALAPGARIEGSGDAVTLVLDSNFGLGADHDPDGRFVRWEEALTQLGKVGLLLVERSGQERRVRLGPRALTALGRDVS